MIEPAYLAGLLDGEGCFMLRRNKPKKGRTVAPLALIVVRMTHEATVRAIAEEFAANSFYARLPSNERHAAYYNAEWRGRRAEALAEMVEPYLITKKTQAEAIIEAGLLRRGLARGRPLADDDRDALADEFDVLMDEVREGNQRGRR